MDRLTAVIFDLGNVLVDWSPYHFFLDHGYSEQEAETLMRGPVALEWHSIADCGVPMAEIVRQRVIDYPEHHKALTLYLEHWHDTIRGPIAGTAALLDQLAKTGLPLYALTNFPADVYPAFASRFDFMAHFKSVVVSGEVGMKKPDRRIFALAADRFGVDPSQTLFIDDRLENCEAAGATGFQWHHFSGPKDLKADLEARGLLGNSI